MDLLAFSVCITRWIVLLCLAILKPFMCQIVQCDRRCGHVSMLLLGHRVQLGFECVSGQNMFLQ